jgi:hypothetical protein
MQTLDHCSQGFTIVEMREYIIFKNYIFDLCELNCNSYKKIVGGKGHLNLKTIFC